MNILSEDGLKTLISEIKAFVKEKIPTKTSQLTNDSNYIPASMALVDELGANRFAFINPDAVTMEYSTDKGVTWSDSGATNESKRSLFTTSNNYISFGNPNATNEVSNGNQVRITLTLTTQEIKYLFGHLDKMLICYDSKGHSSEMKLETRTGENYKNNKDEWATVGAYKMPNANNMSWIDIPLNLDVGMNYSSKSIWQIRFTFYYTGLGQNLWINTQINAIFGYGQLWFTADSNMGKTGHLYTYDINQNVTFPAEVTATNFKGKVNGYTVEKSVPSDAKFTDTTYDLSPYAKTVDVDTKLSTKADKNTSVIITLPKTGWTLDQLVTAYTISIPVEGITADDDLLIDIYVNTNYESPLSLSENRSVARLPAISKIDVCGTATNYETEFAKIKYAESLDGQIKFYSTEASLGMDITLLVRKL